MSGPKRRARASTPRADGVADAGPATANENLSFEALLGAIRACRLCRDAPRFGAPLDHEPRPILQAAERARICIASQAPGVRVHASGRPFDDPSGMRLRQWLEMDENEFRDASKVAIVPMGFCFPGLTPGGADRPPRRECAPAWRAPVFARLPNLRLLLLVGGYAQRWHLGPEITRGGVNETVRAWRRILDANPSLPTFPLPHPSWHNNRWLALNPWFEAELLPALRERLRMLRAGRNASDDVG